MEQHILIPVDFSSVSEEQLAFLPDLLGEPAEARATLAYVIQPLPPIYYYDAPVSLPEPDVEAFQKRLDKLAMTLQAKMPKLKVETLLLHGSPGSVLVETIEANEVTEVVIGSHGHGAFFDLLFGSTSASVLKRADCPVYVVPTPEKGLHLSHTDRIVALVDLSENSARVVEAAAAASRRSGKRVIVLYAEELDSIYALTGYADLSRFKHERRAALVRALDELSKNAWQKGAPNISCLVRFGPAISTIRDEIETIDPSLVVMGAHRDGAIHDLILGSVSRRLLKALKLPILVAPPIHRSKPEPTESSPAQEAAAMVTPY